MIGDWILNTMTILLNKMIILGPFSGRFGKKS